MTLPPAGGINSLEIATELGLGLPFSSIDPRVLALAGKSAPPVTMPADFYGKSAYTPMTLTTANGSGGPASSENSGGSVSGQATVAISGGTGGYSIQWTVTSNTGGASIGALNGNGVSATKTFTKLSNGSATVLLTVTVTDGTGQSVTRTGVEIDLYWGTAN